MVKLKLNNPGKEFTIGIDVRTLTMIEVEEDMFPTENDEWQEVVEVTIGFLIFSIIIHV